MVKKIKIGPKSTENLNNEIVLQTRKRFYKRR
jgi:hypothetical protein